MATFATGSGTGTFKIATPDGRIPRPNRKLNYSVEHRPYSNTDVIDIGGMSARDLRLPLIILAANLGSMESRLGETGTLTESSFTETATLLELSNIISNYEGTHFWADAYWILTA